MATGVTPVGVVIMLGGGDVGTGQDEQKSAGGQHQGGQIPTA